MSMRLRGSKSELEAAGLDVEGMASSTSKLREEMMALTGVDIMIDDDTFKSSYDILMGIGEVWDQLTDVSQANVTEILFGKRQANIGTAILQNYERVQEIYETALNSDGSAEKENEKYLESVQGHLDQLQAKWQSFGANLADADGLKTFIDLAGGLVTVLDTLTNIFGAAGMAAVPFFAMFSKLGNKGKLNMPSYVVTHRMMVA